MLTVWKPTMDLFDVFKDNFWDMPQRQQLLYKDEETKEQYTELDLPGVKKEHISISIEGRRLNIKAERKGKREGKYAQTMFLPKTLDIDTCRVTLEEGVLRISFKEIGEDKPAKKEIPIT